jgi:hypothetical protein
MKKPKKQPRKVKPVQYQYTRRDATGMLWRFEGSRPVSALADQVMADVMAGRKGR